jgi:hypothetical protein
MPKVRAEELSLTDVIVDDAAYEPLRFEVVSLHRMTAGGVKVCTENVASRYSRASKLPTCETVAPGKVYFVQSVRSGESEAKRVERIYRSRGR